MSYLGTVWARWPVAIALAAACGDDVSPSDGTASSTAGSGIDSADTDPVGATSTSGDPTTGSASSGGPFDLTPWVGRYHFEDPFHPFGQSNELQGSAVLANFEIFPDFTARMFYDQCSFDEPIEIAYDIVAENPTVLRLMPGEGESSLRFQVATDLESLRVMMEGPCRELGFEYDGTPEPEGWGSWLPGNGCWVDRCEMSSFVFHVDYCEGEEPPACP